MPKSTMNINSDPMHITALVCLISWHTLFSSTGEACSMNTSIGPLFHLFKRIERSVVN